MKILSAVILAVCTVSTVFSACDEKKDTNLTTAETLETVTDTNGEILGVSYFSEPDKSETQTVFIKLPATSNGKENSYSAVSPENITVLSEENKTENKSPASQAVNGSTEKSTRAKPTFPPTKATTANKNSPTFGNQNTVPTGHIPVTFKPVEPATAKTVIYSTDKPVQTKKTTVVQSGNANETVKDRANGLSVVFKTDNVEINTTASIMIQGTPGETYTIDFYDAPGNVASYGQLVPKEADENGFAEWTFIIPENCEKGSRKIIIRESGSDKFVQTSINVK